MTIACFFELSLHRSWRALLAAACMAGCAEPLACPPADLAPLTERPAYAFVASDYASSAVGLLDREGNVLREAWLDSGSVTPALVTALSGDVVIADSAVAPCVLTLIDRYGTDVLTFLDTCEHDRAGVVLGQLDVGAAHDSNPQDVLRLDDRRALVSRHNPNLDPEAAPLDRGNDLLVIDHREPRVLSRIDLRALDTVQDGEVIFARPASLVRLRRGAGGAVVVGLARSSADFRIAGPGGVGLVDPERGAASFFALEGLSQCQEVDAVPGSEDLAVVTCAGPAFSDEDGRRAGAGVALIELTEGGSLALRAVHRAADHAGAPVFSTWSVPLSADRVIAIAMGDLRVRVPDRVAVLELGASSAAPLLMEATSAFVIGEGAYDPSTGLALLPDADLGAVRRFAIHPERAAQPLDPIELTGCRGLPPREIVRLAD